MEVPQGNSLCVVILNKQILIFFLSFAKSGNGRAEKFLPRELISVEISGRGDDVGKGVRG
jgi:hypothetical protein